MDVESFAGVVRETLESVRTCLAAIEEAAQQDDDPRILALSRGYALLVVPLRDYLTGVQIGRPLPRGLAKRLTDASAPLIDLDDLIARLELHPDLDELGELVRLADSVT